MHAIHADLLAEKNIKITKNETKIYFFLQFRFKIYVNRNTPIIPVKFESVKIDISNFL